ncbi:hypothetical protein SLA2020_197930 [Shorea laevis]
MEKLEIMKKRGKLLKEEKRGKLPSPTELQELKELVRHHIESYDYMVEEGLDVMLKRIKPVQISDSFTNKRLRNILSFFFFVSIFVPYDSFSSPTTHEVPVWPPFGLF